MFGVVIPPQVAAIRCFQVAEAYRNRFPGPSIAHDENPTYARVDNIQYECLFHLLLTSYPCKREGLLPFRRGSSIGSNPSRTVMPASHERAATTLLRPPTVYRYS